MKNPFPKINLRMIGIIAACGLLSLLAANFIYSDAQRKANPEALKEVVVFTKDVKLGEIVKEDSIQIARWQDSKVPPAALSRTSDVVGKRLAYGVHKGQPAFPDTAVARGFEQVKTTGFEIGIDVPTISNFLGTQLKPGGRYLLLHRPENSGATEICMVMVTGLIDANGVSLVNEAGVAKTVNVSVEEKPTMLWIASLKGYKGSFELVKAPEDYVISAGQALPPTDSGKVLVQ